MSFCTNSVLHKKKTAPVKERYSLFRHTSVHSACGRFRVLYHARRWLDAACAVSVAGIGIHAFESPVNHNHRREGRALRPPLFIRYRSPTKLEHQPTPDKADFRASQYVIMKPCCVCPCRDQHHDSGSGLLRLGVSLFDPGVLISSSGIRWIAKYSFSRPILRKPVLLRRIIPPALVVCIRSASVQREMKFRVQFSKYIQRCFPVVAAAGK